MATTRITYDYNRTSDRDFAMPVTETVDDDYDRQQPPAPESAPTPLPWRLTSQNGIDQHGYGCIVGDNYSTDEEGDRSRTGTDRIAIVALATDHDQANAKLIVTAVNSHAQLVAALEQVSTQFRKHTCKLHGPMVCDKCEALKAADAALARSRAR